MWLVLSLAVTLTTNAHFNLFTLGKQILYLIADVGGIGIKRALLGKSIGTALQAIISTKVPAWM